MTLSVSLFDETQQALWDDFCRSAPNATFLHTRSFLSYHGERFEDASLLIFDGPALVGVMPAARCKSDPQVVVSHPGATYGGVVHQGWLLGDRMLSALQAAAERFRQLGYRKLAYKMVPVAYARVPSQDDSYALFRLGAVRTRCDLSSTIDMAARRDISTRRRRGLKKSLGTVRVTEGSHLLAVAHQVIAANLEREHGAKAVHSLEELTLLTTRFPDSIKIFAAERLDGGQVVAAVVFFNSERVWHAQYIASTPDGYSCSALDAVFASAIEAAGVAGARYFDFGISNEKEGQFLNDGLYRFKSEFGGSGMVHEFFELTL